MCGGELANLLKPNTVKVVTQDGELHVTISLELTINLNSDDLKIAVAPTHVVSDSSVAKKTVVTNDNPMWEIPDFTSTPKVEFGKKV